MFDDQDDLIRHFGGTPAGQAMIAAYHNARNIIDRGGNTALPPGGDPTPPPAAARRQVPAAAQGDEIFRFVCYLLRT